MRTFLVILAVLSLAVRWTDAVCGCAEHNAWGEIVCASSVTHQHASSSGKTEPAFEHGCVSDGPAVYATGLRIQTNDRVIAAPSAASAVAVGPSIHAGAVDRASHGGRPPSRAALQVYRV